MLLKSGDSWDAHSCQPTVLEDSSNHCLLLKVFSIFSKLCFKYYLFHIQVWT